MFPIGKTALGRESFRLYALYSEDDPNGNSKRGQPLSWSRATGRVWGDLRLVMWAPGGGIWDVKEQSAQLLPAGHGLPAERAVALLEGWRAAVERVLNGGHPEVCTLMPWDLCRFNAGVCRLKKPTTAAEYEAAFLTQGRLGRWVLED